ncbi:antibiotic biosynthesis monooxygenase [Actinoallomurus sp. NPDC052308]|uniref:antibiotic biosynthesis monooxygenase family protein n=1 Tax=Actinoallomurus sp. NPDC052308 TaxID=3155530 RepID=UPI00341457EE
MSTVHVLLYVTDPDDAPGSVEAAYHDISRALDGTPGLVGNRLLRSVGDPRSFAVHSEWTDLEAFQVWERGNDHRSTTASLRPLQDATRGATFGIYEVAASY